MTDESDRSSTPVGADGGTGTRREGSALDELASRESTGIEPTTNEATARESTDDRSSLRAGLESVGIALTAALAVAMIAVIGLNWLRTYPYAETYSTVETLYRTVGIDPYAGIAFEQFMLFGAWMDYYLGTSVFRYEFYWRSIATGVLIGIVAPLVGSFVVHREMALIGETLAHTAFAGIAVGLLIIGVTAWNPPLLGVALVVGVFGALCVQWLTDRTSTYGDVPIAIMLVGSFAIGTLLIELARNHGTTTFEIEVFLFGNITTVPRAGTQLMAVLSVVVVAVIAVTYKQLLFITFDEQAARVAQLPVGHYNTLLIVLTAVVVVGSMQVLGVILVAAMLVIPVAAASQLANSFREMLVISVLFGELSILGGFALAFSQSLPAGGSIVVAAIVIYLLSIAASSRKTALSTH